MEKCSINKCIEMRLRASTVKHVCFWIAMHSLSECESLLLRPNRFLSISCFRFIFPLVIIIIQWKEHKRYLCSLSLPHRFISNIDARCFTKNATNRSQNKMYSHKLAVGKFIVHRIWHCFDSKKIIMLVTCKLSDVMTNVRLTSTLNHSRRIQCTRSQMQHRLPAFPFTVSFYIY